MPGKDPKSLRGGAGGEAPCPAERSDAGTSLVLNQNNRYGVAIRELHEKGRCQFCGHWTIRGYTPDGQSEKLIRLNCKRWCCAYCGPRKAWLYKERIRELAESYGLTRFLTLTLDPAKLEGDPVRYLRKVFNKFRVSLLRKFACSITYIAVLEFHKSGIPHLHILIDRFIPQAWISDAWSALGGGEIVDIRYVDVHRISHYLAKYLTKELLMSAPARSRRVTTSRSLHLADKKARDTNWALDRRSIFFLYAILSSDASDIQLDCDGFLFSFVVPAGIETPSWMKGRSFITLTLGRFRNAWFAVLLVW